jgi:hypothetical protein
MTSTIDQLAAMLQAKIEEGPQSMPAWVAVCLWMLAMAFVYTQIEVRLTLPLPPICIMHTNNTSSPTRTARSSPRSP